MRLILQGEQPVPSGGDFDLLSVAWALLVTSFFAIPLAITVWAFLDVAHRPQWAWALSGRRQLLWLIAIPVAALSVVGGLVVSSYYLSRVRPHVRSVEDGDIG